MVLRDMRLCQTLEVSPDLLPSAARSRKKLVLINPNAPQDLAYASGVLGCKKRFPGWEWKSTSRPLPPFRPY
eukprot:778740-Pleurochrysis_carterae.AAC.2